MGEDSCLLQAGEIWEEASAINSKRPAASCHNLVAVKLCHLPGQQIFFTNSFGVTSEIGHFWSLLWTRVLFLIVLTACLCALVVFVSILQQKSTEAHKRLLCHLHYFCSNSMTPKIIRRWSFHRYFCYVCYCSNHFKQQIHHWFRCCCPQRLHIKNGELFKQLIPKQ